WRSSPRAAVMEAREAVAHRAQARPDDRRTSTGRGREEAADPQAHHEGHHPRHLEGPRHGGADVPHSHAGHGALRDPRDRGVRRRRRGSERVTTIPVQTAPSATAAQISGRDPGGGWLLEILAKRTYHIDDAGRLE